MPRHASTLSFMLLWNTLRYGYRTPRARGPVAVPLPAPPWDCEDKHGIVDGPSWQHQPCGQFYMSAACLVPSCVLWNNAAHMPRQAVPFYCYNTDDTICFEGYEVQ